jgi:hypothetical protein
MVSGTLQVVRGRTQILKQHKISVAGLANMVEHRLMVKLRSPKGFAPAATSRRILDSSYER